MKSMVGAATPATADVRSRAASMASSSFTGARVTHAKQARVVSRKAELTVTAKVGGKSKQAKPVVDKRAPNNPTTVSAIILGGGAGSRLYPLTKSRAKPAVPIGGLYRLIDVPMSNCINSGINKVYILTQYNSTSLNRHMGQTYNLGNLQTGSQGFVEVLAATQTPTDKNWFQGTADAVRQYAWLLEDIKNRNIEDIVILSGDHLYRMDYMQFVDAHRESGADITLGCIPCDDERASDFGLMKIDDEGAVTEFAEKPKGDALKAMQVDTTVLGLSPEKAKQMPYIASMGIYVFKKDVLLQLLKYKYPHAHDFGGEIIPAAAAQGLRVQAYLFDDYWEDIGTIKAFFEANLALANQPPAFEFYDPDFPVYTYPHYLPPANVLQAQVDRSIVCSGSSIGQGAKIKNSIIGLRSTIGANCDIDRAYVMGADYFETPAQVLSEGNGMPMGVGEGTTLRNTIVDKNARIGKGCTIVNKAGVEEANREDEGIYIRSGIVTVLRNATVDDGTTI
ncbi:unnamed protein product [Pedinophyceae sp. YPF-701]|nr:unnamed protein product [Pedinophyceae sp. YPF-701]